jgi:hypothetical protein
MSSLARNKNGTNLSPEEMERAVWFDIEKQIDGEIGLTGYLVDDHFTIVVHDQKLKIGAEYSDLVFQPAREFYRSLVQRCQTEDRLLISYTNADLEFVTESNPELEDAVKAVHQKTKFTSFFRHQHPELFAEMQRRLKIRKRSKKHRFTIKQKKNGEFVVGLKDILKLEAVGYPEREKVGIGGSAKAIGNVRKRFDKSGHDLGALTKGEKKAWSKMLTYLRHDVYGLRHLTEWVNNS